MPKTIKKDIVHADGIDIGIYTSDYEIGSGRRGKLHE